MLLISVIIAFSGIISHRHLNPSYQLEIEGRRSRRARMMQHYFLHT